MLDQAQIIAPYIASACAGVVACVYAWIWRGVKRDLLKLDAENAKLRRCISTWRDAHDRLAKEAATNNTALVQALAENVALKRQMQPRDPVTGKMLPKLRAVA